MSLLTKPKRNPLLDAIGGSVSQPPTAPPPPSSVLSHEPEAPGQTAAPASAPAAAPKAASAPATGNYGYPAPAATAARAPASAADTTAPAQQPAAVAQQPASPAPVYSGHSDTGSQDKSLLQDSLNSWAKSQPVSPNYAGLYAYDPTLAVGINQYRMGADRTGASVVNQYAGLPDTPGTISSLSQQLQYYGLPAVSSLAQAESFFPGYNAPAAGGYRIDPYDRQRAEQEGAGDYYLATGHLPTVVGDTRPYLEDVQNTNPLTSSIYGTARGYDAAGNPNNWVDGTGASSYRPVAPAPAPAPVVRR